jgi:7-cyano-7-deazaguanine synthase in queuosine biosynthesis
MSAISGEDYVGIENIILEKFSDYQELSADVDGEKLWFRFPLDIELQARAEIFLPLAMFEAMVRGVPVRVDKSVPISAKFKASLNLIQSIFHCWNKDLSTVPVYSKTTETWDASNGIMSCFSGGVDSTYTYSVFKKEITHLLLVRGFEEYGSDVDWGKHVSARSEFSQSQNVKLISVDTNARLFADTRRLSWLLVHGGVLGGIAASLNVEKFMIPSSATYLYLFPEGSHPLIDPLWSTETTSVVHHGADVSRSYKTEIIAQNKSLRDRLQVCWRSTVSNCGECSKCVRTSVVFHILDKDSESMPLCLNLKKLRILKPDGEGSILFIDDLISFSKRNNNMEIEKIFRRMKRNYTMKNAINAFVKALLGESGRKLINKFRNPVWHKARGALRSKNNEF